jgi:hypothetical protein
MKMCCQKPIPSKAHLAAKKQANLRARGKSGMIRRSWGYLFLRRIST